jgi:hypothetical protein
VPCGPSKFVYAGIMLGIDRRVTDVEELKVLNDRGNQ